MAVKKNIQRVLSVNWLKSLFANLYYFGIRGLNFPILFGYGVRLDSLGDRDSINCQLKFGQMCFCLKPDSFDMGYRHSYWHIGKGARLQLKGSCRISKGSIFHLFNNSELIIGDKFTSNANLLVSCAKHIAFGEECLLGWNITIMDSDGGHQIHSIAPDTLINHPKPISIGSHVWIASEASILKGSEVPDGSVVGYKSNVCGCKVLSENVILAGNPATVVKQGVYWLL